MTQAEQNRMARDSTLGQFAPCAENVKGASFAGYPIEDMSREELLAVVGWFMGQDKAREASRIERAERYAARSEVMAGIV